MRLRQIALVAKYLEPVAAQLHAVFGLQIAFRDPAVGVFGLVNAVMPVGGEFLEIVQPVREDASAARYLQRRGGDAGYMLIFQTEDALAHRERLAAQGIRKIAEHDSGSYTFTHFHPGDFGGVLTSIDMVDDGKSSNEPAGKWPPAGKSWMNFPASSDVLGIVGAAVQARDPSAAAARWADLLEAPRDGDSIEFSNGKVRFVPPMDADGTGIIGVDIAVRDAEIVLKLAHDLNIPVRDDAIWIGGVGFRAISR
jgi:hypothetical protein